MILPFEKMELYKGYSTVCNREIPPMGEGIGARNFARVQMCISTFALKISVFGVREWYTKNKCLPYIRLPFLIYNKEWCQCLTTIRFIHSMKHTDSMY